MKRIVVSVLAVLVLFGCMGKGKEKSQVEDFVKGYCSMLQKVYSEANLEILAGVATEKEYKKVFPVIQALLATGNAMKTEVPEYAVISSEVNDTTATVRTKERWRYWWVDRKTGATTKPKSEETYQLQYNLVKVDGRWRVDSINSLNR